MIAKFLRYVAWTAFFVAVTIAGLRLSVMRWWQVPLGDPYLEASIAPTLHGGDWIILWRGTTPSAGDLTMCPEPKVPTRPVIGRILGLPGERVRVDKSTAFVNGKVADSESSCDSFQVREPASGRLMGQACGNETLADKIHMTGMVHDGPVKPAGADVEVPDAQIFLISDNRQFPWDSRDFGMVERTTCRERIVFRLVSKDGFFDVPNRLTLIH